MTRLLAGDPKEVGHEIYLFSEPAQGTDHPAISSVEPGGDPF